MSAPPVPWRRRDGADLVLQLLVRPRARRDAFAGVAGDRLKVSLTAPPLEGEANAALRVFLARQFGVPRNQVVLEHGETGRRKRVRIAPRKLPAWPGAVGAAF